MVPLSGDEQKKGYSVVQSYCGMGGCRVAMCSQLDVIKIVYGPLLLVVTCHTQRLAINS